MQPGGGCLAKNCPLAKDFEIITGDTSDEHGQMVWTIEGCALMALFEQKLKGKKPGKPTKGKR